MTLRKILLAATFSTVAIVSGATAQDMGATASPETAAPETAAPVASATPVRKVRPTVPSLTADLAAAQAELASAQAAVADLTLKSQRQTLAVENAQAELKAQRDAGKLKDELIVLGRQRNDTLYKIAGEVLDKYLHIDLRENLSRREPFVQAKRVELENEVQAYEDRLRESRLYENTLPPSLERRMQDELTTTPAPSAAAQ